MRLAHRFSCMLLATGILPVLVSAQDRVLIEAETATDLQEPLAIIDAAKPDAVQVAKGASGDKYLEVAPGKGKPAEGAPTGQAALKFTVAKAGTYVLWARCFWQDGCGNSVTMQLDDKPAFTFGQDSTYNAWHWVKVPPPLAQMKLSRGEHKLVLRNREDGVRFDQILLVNDARYVPVDIEDAAP